MRFAGLRSSLLAFLVLATLLPAAQAPAEQGDIVFTRKSKEASE